MAGCVDMREAKILRMGLSQARQQLAFLICRVQEGKTVILTRNGSDVARLVAVGSEPNSQPVAE